MAAGTIMDFSGTIRIFRIFLGPFQGTNHFRGFSGFSGVSGVKTPKSAGRDVTNKTRVQGELNQKWLVNLVLQ